MQMEWLLNLSLSNWFLAVLPLFILLMLMMTGKISAARAAILAYSSSVVIGIVIFGSNGSLILVASLKGLSLSFFVLAIIWASVFLYNIVNDVGGMSAIGQHLLKVTDDKTIHALLLGWCFAGFIQGVTGFGVPVAVVVPLLVMSGIGAVPATTAALIGHSWAVTFGSLGSSYYSIQLVSGISGSVIAPAMALMFIIPVLMTGFAVAHITGGMAATRRLSGVILIVGLTMAGTSWAMTVIGVPQLASTVAGLVGCGLVWSWIRFSRKETLEVPEGEHRSTTTPLDESPKIGFHKSFAAYYVIFGLTSIAQLPGLNQFLSRFSWGVNYPETATSYDFTMPAATNYAAFEFFAHPAPLIILSAIVTLAVFRRSVDEPLRFAGNVLRKTYAQSVSSTIAVSFMVAMALVMQHSGMTEMIAQGIAVGSGTLFPVISPFLGLLGAFMTGSNTNSNVMFGALQVETARTLAINPVVIASAQSIGGSLGSAVTPAKVLLGTTLLGIAGQEGSILRKGLTYCIPMVLVVGVETIIASRLF